MMTTRKLRRVAQFCNQYDEFTEGGMRWLIFQESENGLADVGAIKRVGRSVFIDVEAFFLWVELQNTGELSDVIDLINQKKGEGVYMTPDDAVKEIRYPDKSQQRIKASRHA